MLKVFLTPLIASVAVWAAAGPLIPIKTRSTAFVFSTDANNHLTRSYVGPASDAPETYDRTSDHENVVYPTAGSVFHSQPALRVTHFDGNTSTDLVYMQHAMQDLGSGVTLTIIQLKDRYYPFFVNLYIRSYASDEVLEEWTQVRRSRKP
jgi:alpha-galactosidase